MAYTTINKSTDHFNTKLYTGTGSAQSITGVGFQPDWSWIKNASSGSNYSHTLTDAVRGVTKHNASNNSNAEYTSTTEITSFNSDGFSVGTDVGVNSNGSTIVSWNWKANGQGSSNTDGSINTTYTSANTTAGISIIQYTGTGSNATIGHGLGAVPSVILVKKTSGTGDWIGYFKSLGNTKNARLNETEAADTNSTVWNSTTPTSSVFSVGTFGETNGSGATFVAYCFAEKTGFSKFGSYTGNGNADGVFIYTGFKPAFIITKRTDSGDFWMMQDSARSPTNVANKYIQANASAAESTTNDVALDMLSNGFKLRNTGAHYNGSGGSYIYLAFAEEPLVGSNNIPATAR